jgi:histidinol-phosphate/aromatic aminotransferase/cobyric acid decarboxylase-like protein
MALMLARIQVDDYDAWKEMFDSGRETVREHAKGHRIVRGVEDPNELFIQVEFPSVEDAHAARERLLASGMMDRVAVQNGPTVAELAETIQY